MSDNPLASSFMMLTENLYGLFVQYIVSGRMRAPPEFLLAEMLPTFQFGAKTDRRALQSKFKCWAKRMKYENGCLTLANSGKILIPRQKCDDVIMVFHSEKHNNVENVISQIRMIYSWTKKDFGMDRDVVVECIARNCKRKDCLENMRMELSRLNSNFCNSGPSLLPLQMLTSELNRGMSPQILPSSSSHMYKLPVPFPLAPIFPANGLPFEMTSLGVEKDKIIPMSVPVAYGNMLPDNLITGNNLSDLKFRQPTNTLELKTLMEAVRHNPNTFPKILGNKKTLFLSTLGIAPKSICSSRTLKRFREEHRNRQFLSRDCIVYRERKVLRDKSKLKNCSFQRRSYLEMPKSKDSTSPQAWKSTNQRSPIKKMRGFNFNNSMNKYRKHKDKMRKPSIMRKDTVEVIDIISSSDDEIEKENAFLIDNSAEIGVEDIGSTERQQSVQGNEILDKSTDNQNLNVPTRSVCKEKNNQKHQDPKLGNCFVTPALYYPIPSVNPYPLKMFPANKLNTAPVLMPKEARYNEVESNGSSIPFQMKHIQAHQIFRPYVVQRANCLRDLMFPQISPAPVTLRQMMPVSDNSFPYFAVPNQPAVPQFVYAIPNSNMSSNAESGHLKEGQKRGFVVARQFNMHKEDAQTVASNELIDLVVPTSNMNQPHQKGQSQKKKLRRDKRKSNKSKPDINEEMMRILKWISRMKAVLNPNMFQNNVERSVLRLITQLNYGIQLVKEAKECLSQLEENIEFKEFVSEKLT